MRELFYCTIAACFALSLTSCAEKAPEKPISQMTSAELEEVVSKGGAHRDEAVLMLSNAYLRYGSEEQKLRATGYLISIARSGNMKAKTALCDPQYWGIAGDVAVTQCEEAAEAKHGKAYAAFCLNELPEKDYAQMCMLAAQSGERDAFVEHAKYLLNDGKDSEAYDWLIKAVEDGTPQQRDLAVSLLRGLPDRYAGVYGRASSQKEETAYVPIRTVEPRVPGYRKKGQCYVTWAITPSGHPFLITVDCTHKEIEDQVKFDVHDWRFEPSKNGATPVFTRKQSTTIYFNQ